MRFLSNKQSEILSKLVALADGDLDLVLRAVRQAGAGRDAARLTDVIDNIVRGRKVAYPAPKA